MARYLCDYSEATLRSVLKHPQQVLNCAAAAWSTRKDHIVTQWQQCILFLFVERSGVHSVYANKVVPCAYALLSALLLTLPVLATLAVLSVTVIQGASWQPAGPAVAEHPELVLLLLLVCCRALLGQFMNFTVGATAMCVRQLLLDWIYLT